MVDGPRREIAVCDIHKNFKGVVAITSRNSVARRQRVSCCDLFFSDFKVNEISPAFPFPISVKISVTLRVDCSQFSHPKCRLLFGEHEQLALNLHVRRLRAVAALEAFSSGKNAGQLLTGQSPYPAPCRRGNRRNSVCSSGRIRCKLGGRFRV